MKNAIIFIVSILLAQTAGIIGSLFTVPNIEVWYTELTKPTWNPPSWIFGPVWITLFTLMGVAMFLVWQTKRAATRTIALKFYLIQLALNALWSLLFFGIHRPDLAFIEIVILWIFILLTLISFWKTRILAGWLLVPYLAWVSFAAVLNFTIWQLN